MILLSGGFAGNTGSISRSEFQSLMKSSIDSEVQDDEIPQPRRDYDIISSCDVSEGESIRAIYDNITGKGYTLKTKENMRHPVFCFCFFWPSSLVGRTGKVRIFNNTRHSSKNEVQEGYKLFHGYWFWCQRQR